MNRARFDKLAQGAKHVVLVDTNFVWCLYDVRFPLVPGTFIAREAYSRSAKCWIAQSTQVSVGDYIAGFLLRDRDHANAMIPQFVHWREQLQPFVGAGVDPEAFKQACGEYLSKFRLFLD